MNKYFSKGLLYQWFNSSKAFILLGMIIWGFVANTIINGNIGNVSREIAYDFNNGYTTFRLPEYLILGFIFAAIHCVAQGTNKRNTTMFLTSSPYTKKQIKYNQLICLMLTLALFILVFIYIATMAYIRNIPLMNIVEGYAKITGIEVIRIFLFGTIGILIMLIIDSMFSNSIIGLISMITVIPASVMLVFGKIFNTLDYISIKGGKNIFEILYSKNNFKGEYIYKPNPLIDCVSTVDISSFELCKSIVITIIIMGILFLLFKIMQRINTLEFSTKLFTSKINERIITMLVSFGAGSLASLLVAEKYIDSLRRSFYEYSSLTGSNLLKALSADLICIGIVTFIAYKIIKKILKAFS